MLKPNLVRTGFLLGVSLLLAAIVYFFAANWGGLDRMQKIALSAGLVALFYGTSFAMTRFRVMRGHHHFLAGIFLVGGCITFGIAIALIGQIYNSHADSFGLFLLWSIPALLFAAITRYAPFYVLSYVLVHFTLWFYFFPSSLTVEHGEGKLAVIVGTFAVLNLILFFLTEIGRLKSAPIKWMSFIVVHISLLWLSNSLIFEYYGVRLNILSVAAIAAGFYYFIHVRLDKVYVTLNALAASVFAVLKFIELAEEHASSMFFFYGLLFVALLLTGNVLFFRYLQQIPSHSDAGEERKERSGALAGKIVSTIVMIIGVIIGSISLSGLVFMAAWAADPENTLFILSLLFVIPMIFLPRLNAVVRYTVLTIGYVSGIAAVLWIGEPVLSALYLILSAAGWIRMEGRVQRLFTYVLININVMILLHQLFDVRFQNWNYIILTLTVLNTIVYALHYLLPEGAIKHQFRNNGLYFSLFFLLWLTFMEDIFPYSYEIFNLLNFGLVTSLVFLFLRREQGVDASISLAFWFVFLAYKYYDLLWSLLHKSLTLAILGLIALLVTYTIARRIGGAADSGEYNGFLRKKMAMILLVIVLQFSFLGYQTAASEHLLTTGTSIKLELQPLDPRSLLQGDYVRLNYTISTPPDHIVSELENLRSRSKVNVVLVPDDRGIYKFDRLLKKGEAPGSDEVLINGVTSGWRSIHYGIESYFVPEGTGLDVEQSASFAYVRVSASGDALLERLTEE